MDGRELEHGQEVGGVFFIARGDPSEVFDPIEEALDAVTGSVEHGTEGGLPATMGIGGMLGAAPAASTWRRSQSAS